MASVSIVAVRADITTLNVDAIVNAANRRMLGGGGVDGAIHAAAGPRLVEACRAMPEVRPGVRCPTGEARLTPGFDLPARFIIHTVGPIWDEHEETKARELLAACYRNCIAMAGEQKLTTIAFPCVGAGVFGVPIEVSAEVAVASSRREAPHAGLSSITLCCFSEGDLRVYREQLGS